MHDGAVLGVVDLLAREHRRTFSREIRSLGQVEQHVLKFAMDFGDRRSARVKRMDAGGREVQEEGGYELREGKGVKSGTN